MPGKPGKLLFTLPRPAVAVSNVKKGALTLQAELVVEGQYQGLRVVFPKPAREDGQRVISALGTTAPPECPLSCRRPAEHRPPEGVPGGTKPRAQTFVS
jgi:hypothetical protein